MCVHIALPSPKSCPWLQKKVTSINLWVMLANPSAPATSPEVFVGICVPEGQGSTQQLGDKWARPCQDIQWKPNLLKAEVWLGQGAGCTGDALFLQYNKLWASSSSAELCLLYQAQSVSLARNWRAGR